MPSGIYPVPEFRSTKGRGPGTRPSVALRIRTRWSRKRLDRELAGGADPETGAKLSLRAEQLRSEAERARLADALVDIIGEASRSETDAIGSRRPRLAVLRHREDLQALIERLRDGQPVAVRGAAMTARLLSDRASALHRDSGQDLQNEIRAARFALDTTDPTREGLARAA